MGILAPKPQEPDEEQVVRDQLVYWREHLREALSGTNTPTEQQCRSQLDHWLDELLVLLATKDIPSGPTARPAGH